MSRFPLNLMGGCAAVAGVLVSFVAMQSTVHAGSEPGFVHQSVLSSTVHPGEPATANPGSDFAVQTTAGPGFALAGSAWAGESDISTYMRCWENRLAKSSNAGPDSLTIEIRVPRPDGEVLDVAESAASEPLLIPLPPAVWSGLGGLLGVGALGVVRRARGRRW